MEERQSRSSWFASVPGVLVLLLFAVTANYFRAWQISAFFFLLFFLCSGALLWSRRVLRRAALSLSLMQKECHAGERLSLRLKVRNHSFFPLVWLDVILPVGEKALVRRAEEEKPFWYVCAGEQNAQAALRQRFAWLLWQQEILWQEELLALQRGLAMFSRAELSAGDGFGLSSQAHPYFFAAPVSLTIYPRRLPVDVQPFLRVIQEAAAGKRGQMEDVTLMKSSRPYQPGDSVKGINWRLLAGSGRMEVKVYETVTPGCITFVLDLSSFQVIKEQKNSQGGTYREVFLRERELERMISLTASCIRELAERQITPALIIPAYGKREAYLCVPGNGEDSRRIETSAFREEGLGYEAAARQCLEELARLDYRGEEVRFPYEEFWQAFHQLGMVCICVRTDQGRSFEALAEELGQSRVRYLAGEKASGRMPDHECLYGEDICWELELYRTAEREVPEEVRIGVLREEAKGKGEAG